jgi:hypothetical protein
MILLPIPTISRYLLVTLRIMERIGLIIILTIVAEKIVPEVIEPEF